MVKSQIIKDLANGTVDLHTSLKRAKVIFQEIGSEDLKCQNVAQSGKYINGTAS